MVVSLAPQPKLVAILVSDEIIRDVRTRKFSLIGLFSRVAVRQFPARHGHLHVFVSVTNGHGVADAELRCSVQGEADPVGGIKGKIQFPSPESVVDMHFDITNLVFPKAGHYSFDFYCDGALIGSRPFDVVQEEVPPPKSRDRQP